MLTPLHLEIVIHYHTRAFDMENFNAPNVLDYVNDLLKAGVIEDTNGHGPKSYQLSEKGMVWFNALLSTPFPVQKWVIPQ